MQIKEALLPDGVFLGAMLGGETLFELRYALLALPSASLCPDSGLVKHGSAARPS